METREGRKRTSTGELHLGLQKDRFFDAMQPNSNAQKKVPTAFHFSGKFEMQNGKRPSLLAIFLIQLVFADGHPRTSHMQFGVPRHFLQLIETCEDG